MANLVANLKLDRRLRHRNPLRSLVFDDAVVQHLERFFDHSQLAVHKHLEACLGAIKMPTSVFTFLDKCKKLTDHRVLLIDARLDSLELFNHQGTACLIARHKHAVITHGMRVNVFKAARHLHHTIDVSTTLMRKGGIPHVRGVHIARQVHNLIHITTQLTESCHLFSGKELRPHLKVKVGGDRRKICITATFTIAVHHTLHHQGAILNSIDAIAYGKASIIMNMDSDGRRNFLFYILYNFFEFPRHRAAIGITKNNAISTTLFGSAECFYCIFRICLVAIKKMFRIINHFFGMFLEVRHRRLDHVEVLFESRADDIGHMQVPALSENRLNGSTGLHERLQQRVVLGQNLRATSRTEGGNLCVFQLDFLDFLEKFLVGRITRIGPPPFDIVKTEMVKNSRNLQLVGKRKAYLTVLVTVTEGSII